VWLTSFTQAPVGVFGISNSNFPPNANPAWTCLCTESKNCSQCINSFELKTERLVSVLSEFRRPRRRRLGPGIYRSGNDTTRYNHHSCRRQCAEVSFAVVNWTKNYTGTTEIRLLIFDYASWCRKPKRTFSEKSLASESLNSKTSRLISGSNAYTVGPTTWWFRWRG